MKNKLLSLSATLAALALGACSGGGGTPDAGSTDAGFTNITFATVDIHPAAKAALLAAGATVPSLTPTAANNGPYDAGYKLIVNGVAIGPGPSILLSNLADFPVTTNGPYTYAIYNSDIVAKAPLGILAGVNPALPDGGSPDAPDAGLTQIPCALLADAGIAGGLAKLGIPDYYFATGSQVGGTANPPSADVPNAVGYAVPMSYASLLNCAGSAIKATRDSDLGVALIYVTDTGPGSGAPVSGVSFAIHGAGNTPTLTYYTGGNYTGSSTAAGAATDATGVAVAVDVQTASQPPTLTSTDAASDKFFVPGLATASDSFFNVFVYKK